MKIRLDEGETALRMSISPVGPAPTATFAVVPGASEQTVAPPEGYVFAGGTVAAIPDSYGRVNYGADSSITLS